MKIRWLMILFCYFFSSVVQGQTFNDKYDLGFDGVNKCGWSWLSYKNRTNFAKEENTGRPALTMSYTDIGQDAPMQFVLSKVIILPIISKNSKYEISFFSKSKHVMPLKFILTILDKNENVLFSKSSAIISSLDWKENKLSFKNVQAAAVRIYIEYVGNNDDSQKVWLDQVTIKLNGENLANKNYYLEKRRKTVNLLNPKHIFPLSFNNDSTLLKSITAIHKKKIIGLALSTHGSNTVNEANYQFIKNLISSDNCRTVMLERPLDMVMTWNLYISGKTDEEYKRYIVEDVKSTFDDYEQFMRFLYWLKNYNKYTQNKVRLFGVDNFASPQTYLSEYHLALLKTSQRNFYLKKIQEENYPLLIEHASKDSIIRNVLDEQEFAFYSSVLHDPSIKKQETPSGVVDRDLIMSGNVNRIMALFGTNGQAVILAHSEHLNSLKEMVRYPATHAPLGYYLREKYKEDFFSITFQIGQGTYTQDECSFYGKNITDTLKQPSVYSFEYSGLLSGLNYFYYPSKYISDELMSCIDIPRGARYKNLYQFACLRKRFDAYVFIKNSIPLKNIEAYPMFYAGDMLKKKNEDIRKIIKDFSK